MHGGPQGGGCRPQPSLHVDGWSYGREAGESREDRPQRFSLLRPRSVSDSMAGPHLKPEAEAGLVMQLKTRAPCTELGTGGQRRGLQ